MRLCLQDASEEEATSEEEAPVGAGVVGVASTDLTLEAGTNALLVLKLQRF